MAHSYIHAVSSARRFGGKAEDYLAVHNWFDATKAIAADFRHRALRHHSEGIFLAEQIFGTTILNSAGRPVPVRMVGEQHVREDFNGRIPAANDWLRAIRAEPWMHVRPADMPTEGIYVELVKRGE
jgi:hypothetical protein